MALPFNTFTIHNFIGFMVTASLAVVFYLAYFGLGRRLLDLLSANFIASISVMCLVSLITDNLVPAGMPARGWPGGPTADQLARTTVEAHRFLWAAGLIAIPSKLHFALRFAGRSNWLARHIGWVYAVCLGALPLVWTDAWLTAATAPAAETSSWSVAIPWMPVTGWPLLPFTLAWYTVTGYSVWVLWRTRNQDSEAESEYGGQRRLVLIAFAAQMGICMLDLVFVIVGYMGISLIPVGGMAMGVLLAVALFRSRLGAYRQRIRLESERTAILESVPQPMVYVDRDFAVQWSNPAAGGSPQSWAEPDSPQRAVVEQARAQGRASRGEVSLADGTTWIVHASPVRMPGGDMPGAVVLALDITPLRRAEQALRAANAQILTARDQERRRLAADLHDSLAQGLATLKLSLDVAYGRCPADSPEAEVIAATSEQCRRLVGEVRSICHDLYPPALDSLGLTTAVRRLLRDVARTGADCHLHCPGHLETRRLAPAAEIALFRVTQEAVNNAIRHGHARRIDVHIEPDGDAIRLRVIDDGEGFDPTEQVGRGLGMNTMHSRVHGIGGRLAFESRPGQTAVIAHVPETA